MADVVPTFGGREEPKRRRDERVDVIEGTRARSAEERFQFGERLFDRIEVRTVRRQEAERRADTFNGRSDVGLSVHREVIQHDHVAGPQRRHQYLFDVGQETGGVDGPIKHGGCRQPVGPQGEDHRVSFPMSAGRVIVQPHAAGTPAIAAEQIGGDPTLVEKDVLPHIAKRQPGAPAAAVSGDVGPSLLVGVDGFF